VQRQVELSPGQIRKVASQLLEGLDENRNKIGQELSGAMLLVKDIVARTVMFSLCCG
jgi:hypothetical protein